MSAGFPVQPGTRFVSFPGILAPASCALHSLWIACPHAAFPRRMLRLGAARAAESAARVPSAWAPGNVAPGAEPGRRSKCARSALAAAVSCLVAQTRNLQPAGLCARSRGVCARAPVACVLTKVCLLNPLPGCTLHLEWVHPRPGAGS